MFQSAFLLSCTYRLCASKSSLPMFVMQATKPFIDPVTHKKILFIDANNTTTMPEHFHMESLEQCMGGSLSSSQVFNLDHYRAEMTAEDARQQQAYAAVK